VMGKVVRSDWLTIDSAEWRFVFVSFRDSHRGKRTKKRGSELDRLQQLVTWSATWRCNLDQFGSSCIAMSFDAHGHRGIACQPAFSV
jgi:hypothetical protein